MYKKGTNKTEKFPTIIKAFLVLSFISIFAVPAHAGFNDCATDWNNFDNPGFIADYTYKGDFIRDHEATGSGDPTHGQANVPPSETDLASCADPVTNPGSYTTPYFGYYNGGTEYDPEDPLTMEDDYIFFRMRVTADPSSKDGFGNYHWNVLLDVDGDGYKEYWVDIEGKYDTQGCDRLNILYDNSSRQDIEDPDQLDPLVRVNYFSACNTEGTECGSTYGYSHTRVLVTDDACPGDYWIDIQVPMTAFVDSYGNQVLYPDSPVAFVFSTGASANDPLQKDWMMDLDFLSLNDPITFGDIVYPNGKPVIEFTNSSMDFVEFYTIGDYIYVYVNDPLTDTTFCSTSLVSCDDDLDCTGGGDTCIGGVQVTVTDPIFGDDESLVLLETNPGTNIYTNTSGGTQIDTSNTDTGGDNNGTLRTDTDNTIYVSYTNPNSETVTDSAYMLGDSCDAFMQFTRANGLPTTEFLLTDDRTTSDKLYVTVTHAAANTDINSPQTISVSLSGNDEYTLTLTETGDNTGVFRNTTGLDTEIETFPVDTTDDLWEDNDGGEVTATYIYNVGGCSGTEITTADLFTIVGSGRVYFTNSSGTQDVELYGPGQNVYIKVVDDTNCGSGDPLTLTVTVTSTSGDSETVTVTETAPGSGVFMNSSDPLVTATYDGVYVADDGTLEAADGDTLTVTYTDCDDGDSDPNNDNKTDTGTYNAPDILINEVLFYPDSGTCQTEYIQLINSSTSSVNVTGYIVTDGDSFSYTIPQVDSSDIMLGSGEKIYISLYQSGTSPTDQYDSGTGTWYLFDTTSSTSPSDNFGDPGSTDPADQISLYNSSSEIVDYVAWSSTLNPSVDFLGDDSDAVAEGIWQDDAFVNVSLMTLGYAIKRSTDGYDSNTPDDWVTFNEGAVLCNDIITRAVISSFNAYVENGRVVVQWETDSEIGTVGFYLFREDEVTGKYFQLNEELLPGLLVSPQGGTYRYVDETAWPEKAYTYALVEVESRGKDRIHGPYTVTATNQGIVSSDFDMISYNYGRKAHGITDAKKSSIETKKLFINAAIASSDAFARRRGGNTSTQYGEQVKITLVQNGLYYVDASVIPNLQTGTSRRSTAPNNIQVILKNKGQNVAYIPTEDSSGIYFYGEALDSMYTDENVYWLERGSGLRMETTGGRRPAPASGNETFTETINAEEDHWPITGLVTDPQSDYWTWDYIVAGNAALDTRTFNVEANGVAASQEPASLTVQLYGATNTDHHVVVTLNGTKIGESFWYGTRAYTYTASFDQSLLMEGNNNITVKGIRDTGVPFSVFYVDSFDLSYQRLYRACNERLSVKGDGNPVVTIEGFAVPDIYVFDVSNPHTPKIVIDTTIDSLASDNYRVSFVPASPESEYLALTEYGLSTPVSVVSDNASNLKDRSNAVDYLVITPEELKEDSQVLADYRENQGLNTIVAELEDIMDEFNHGIYSPEAIKDFLAYAYYNWTKAPRYVVLIGEGTFDYKDNQGHGDNVLPPIMIGTPHGMVPSDNYYADIDGDHVPEMAIGRLPVATPEELQAVINKIMAYESSAGTWTEHVLMLADNPEEGGDFPADSNDVAAILPPTYTASKVYLSEHMIGEARQLVMNGINSGAMLMNYIGHAGLDRLAQEGLLLKSDVASMTNGDRLPVLTAMTCTVGQFAIPGYDSLAEVIVLKQNGGAIAVWAPTGLSVNSEAVILDKEFFRSAFEYNTQVLGDIVLDALEYGRINGVAGYMLDIYNVLGDPALLLK